jgi:Glu-tRNA(Gln) amidotransferase subunit E-like FAD-binding protein
MENNRHDFNQCAALVFNLLYKEFPMEADINVEELTELSNENMADNYFATLRFLQREGFIRYQEFNFGIFSGAVLTSKGLKILDTIPNIAKEETIAQQLHTALIEDSQKNIGIVIREMIKLSV